MRYVKLILVHACFTSKFKVFKILEEKVIFRFLLCSCYLIKVINLKSQKGKRKNHYIFIDIYLYLYCNDKKTIKYIKKERLFKII